MATVTLNVRLDTDRDASVIRWLASFGKGEKSGVVRQALHAAMMQSGGPTIGDVLSIVERIDARIASGAVVAGVGGNGIQDDDGGEFDLALDMIGV